MPTYPASAPVGLGRVDVFMVLVVIDGIVDIIAVVHDSHPAPMRQPQHTLSRADNQILRVTCDKDFTAEILPSSPEFTWTPNELFHETSLDHNVPPCRRLS